ncbi:MAG: hypothetical protein V1922_05155 [bacterium]
MENRTKSLLTIVAGSLVASACQPSPAPLLIDNHSIPPQPTSLPLESTPETVVDEVHMRVDDNREAVIQRNANSQPTKLLLVNSADQSVISEQTISNEMIKAAKDTAKKNDTVVSVGQLPFEVVDQYSFTPSPDRPAIDSLPPVYDKTELATQHISVIQADDVQFYFRKIPNSLPKMIEQLSAARGKETSLQVIMVPGSSVRQKYLTDAKYDSVRHFVNPDNPLPNAEEASDYRSKQVNTLQDRLTTLEQQYRDSLNRNMTNWEKNQFVSNILGLRHHIDQYWQMSLSAIGEEMLENDAPLGATYYSDGEGGSIEGYVFVAVGKSPNKGQVEIFANQNGELEVIYYFLPSEDYEPRPDLTYPRPDDFIPHDPTFTEKKGYRWQAREGGPVWNTEHEFRHLLRDLAELGTQNNTAEEESATDDATMQAITDAWKKWTESGDDTLYPFIFAVPQQKGGGYIICELLPVINTQKQAIARMLPDIMYQYRPDITDQLQTNQTSATLLISSPSPTRNQSYVPIHINLKSNHSSEDAIHALNVFGQEYQRVTATITHIERNIIHLTSLHGDTYKIRSLQGQVKALEEKRRKLLTQLQQRVDIFIA